MVFATLVPRLARRRSLTFCRSRCTLLGATFNLAVSRPISP